MDGRRPDGWSPVGKAGREKRGKEKEEMDEITPGRATAHHVYGDMHGLVPWCRGGGGVDLDPACNASS
ncbi:hypothetical protein ACP4OV_003004 [Aristida adscensionis]